MCSLDHLKLVTCSTLLVLAMCACFQFWCSGWCPGSPRLHCSKHGLSAFVCTRSQVILQVFIRPFRNTSHGTHDATTHSTEIDSPNSQRRRILRWSFHHWPTQRSGLRIQRKSTEDHYSNNGSDVIIYILHVRYHELSLFRCIWFMDQQS